MLKGKKIEINPTLFFKENAPDSDHLSAQNIHGTEEKQREASITPRFTNAAVRGNYSKLIHLPNNIFCISQPNQTLIKLPFLRIKMPCNQHGIKHNLGNLKDLRIIAASISSFSECESKDNWLKLIKHKIGAINWNCCSHNIHICDYAKTSLSSFTISGFLTDSKVLQNEDFPQETKVFYRVQEGRGAQLDSQLNH